MGSELGYTGALNTSSSVQYCDAPSWKVFLDPSENNPNTISDESQVVKGTPHNGWSFGNLPCPVVIGR